MYNYFKDFCSLLYSHVHHTSKTIYHKERVQRHIQHIHKIHLNHTLLLFVNKQKFTCFKLRFLFLLLTDRRNSGKNLRISADVIK